MRMNGHLHKYLAYAKELNTQRKLCLTLGKFSQIVKYNRELRRLRMEARLEIQTIYGWIRNHFQLPHVDVYLTPRKKPHIAGLAFHNNCSPKEIRIYNITGCGTKSYDRWLPTDLHVATEECVFETFIHESAHILEVCRYGEMGHEEPFVEAYEDIEVYLKDCGYANLINPTLRLTGAPTESYANQVKMRSYFMPKMHQDYFAVL